MARMNEHDYSPPSQWRALADQQRLDLSASVEEAMLDTSLGEELEGDELDGTIPPKPGSTLIPPRLSLQSRSLPVARPALPASYEPSQMARVSPIVSRPAPGAAVERKPFLSKRTTKVRLQVVPGPRPSEILPAAPSRPVSEAITNPGLPLVEEPAARTVSTSSASGAGIPAMGVFECGQRDLAVRAPVVTASSVVVVVLTGDPGPVVVQYISLQPGVGFTAHLSAPAQNRTPFNYVIL
jgi:hypothetical protein